MVEEPDVLQRLEMAIREWRGQVTEAFAELLHTVTKIRRQAEVAAEVAGLEDHLRQAREQRDEMRAQLAAAAKKLEAAAEVTDLEEQLRQAHEERDRLRAQLAAATKKMEAAPEVADLEEQVRRARQGHDQLRAQLALANQELERLRAVAHLTAEAAPSGSAPAVYLKLKVFDEEGKRRRMGEILVSAGLIDREQLEDALQTQAATPRRRLGTILVEKGYTGEDLIAQVLGSQLGLPVLRTVSEDTIEKDAVKILPGRVARQHHCIPMRATEDELVLVMANPLDLIAVDDVERATNRRVIPVVASESEIGKAIERFYGAESAVWF